MGACVGIAILYGIAHDLITANLAVEYFTVHHPHLVESESPFVMALLWGFLATFWVGGIAGAVLIAANSLGRWPKLNLVRVLRGYVSMAVVAFALAMLTLIGVMALSATIPVSKRRPSYEQDRRMVAVGMAHAVSYGSATWLTAGLAVWVLFKRFGSAGETRRAIEPTIQGIGPAFATEQETIDTVALLPALRDQERRGSSRDDGSERDPSPQAAARRFRS